MKTSDYFSKRFTQLHFSGGLNMVSAGLMPKKRGKKAEKDVNLFMLPSYDQEEAEEDKKGKKGGKGNIRKGRLRKYILDFLIFQINIFELRIILSQDLGQADWRSE